MKKIPFTQVLFSLFLSLSLFTMINREFLFLGFDLRYLEIILGLFLLLLRIHKPITLHKDKMFFALMALFLWAFISNISWFWNQLPMIPEKMLNQNILLFSNFLLLLVCFRYADYLDAKHIKKVIVFSCLILAFSIFLVSLGFDLAEISGSGERTLVYATATAMDNINLFGSGYRLAGYAEDPNYACLFFLIGIVVVGQLAYRKWQKGILFVIFGLCFALSCSKTILVSLILGFCYLFFIRIFRKKDSCKLINFVVVTFLILAVLLLPSSGLFATKTTMTTRFSMWNMAQDLFQKSPVIGNGIDSFKSYINWKNNGLWYVQCHSTYWQLLSETGIIGLLLLMRVMLLMLNRKQTKSKLYLSFIFLIFIINFETLQLTVFIYCTYLLGIEKEGKKDETKGIVSGELSQ